MFDIGALMQMQPLFLLGELLDIWNAFLNDFCSAHGYFRGLFVWVFIGAVGSRHLQR